MKSYILRVSTLIYKLGESPKRRLLLVALVVAAAAVFLINVDPVYAQTDNSSPGTLDMLLAWLAGFLITIARVIGLLIVQVIDVLIVPVMQYNGFATSAVVGAGWAVVRDTMNIGFVLILLIIAFGTILFGAEGGPGGRFAWRKQVPRLLIFAVLINFSRTICGLMIDFGQIIMLTFVNAIKDVAGGNFIQLLGLADIVSLDETAIQNAVDAGTGVEIFDLLAAAIAAVAMMAFVLLTMLTFVIILVLRIVMLWILVVLSPLAFFAGGAQDVLGGSMKPYAEWWRAFSSSVIIGPVIVFFLWLALAVAGSGNIAASEGFTVTTAPNEVDINPSGIPIKIFQLDRLVSFVIGMGMLWAGIDAAQRIASALPSQVAGAMKQLIGPSMARDAIVRSAKLTTGLGVGVAAGAVGVAGRGAVRVGGTAGWVGRRAASSLGQIPISKTQRLSDVRLNALDYVGKQAGQLAQGGVIGRAVGTRLATAAGSAKADIKKKELEDVQEAYPEMQKQELGAVQAMAKAAPTNEKGRAAKRAALLALVTEGRFRNNMSTDELKDVYEEFDKEGGFDTIKPDSKLRGEYLKARRQRLDAVSDKDFEGITSRMTSKEILQNVDGNAIEGDASGRIQELLQSRKITLPGTKKPVSLIEAMELQGTGAQKAAIANITNVSEKAKENLVSSGMDEDRAKDYLDSLNPASQRYLAGADDAERKGRLTPDSLLANNGQLAVLAATKAEGMKGDELEAISQDQASANAFMNATGRENLVSQGVEDGTPQADQVAASRYSVSKQLRELGRGGEERQRRMEVLIKQDPSKAASLAGQLNSLVPGAATDSAQKDFLESIDTSTVTEMLANFDSATGDALESTKEDLRKVTDFINKMATEGKFDYQDRTSEIGKVYTQLNANARRFNI